MLDIVAVAAGFVLRAIAGAAATDLPISEWFFIVTSFGALLVVIGKREGEMHALGDRAASVRATLGAYTPEFLRYLRAVATGVVLVGVLPVGLRVGLDQPRRGHLVQALDRPVRHRHLPVRPASSNGAAARTPRRCSPPTGRILLSGAVWAIIYGYAVYRT